MVSIPNSSSYLHPNIMLQARSFLSRCYPRHISISGYVPSMKRVRNSSSASSQSWFFENSITTTNDLQFGICKTRMGHLAESSVVTRAGGSVVHCAVTSAKPAEAKEDFLPLTVDYRSRNYAFGDIPEIQKRRERHGGDDEILVARFVDRAVRTLFPKGYVQDVQVLVTAHAADGVNDPTVLAVNAASLALLNSRQPWFGPIGCVRVGMVDNKLKVNPSVKEMDISPLDLLYAGTTTRAVMIEAGAQQVNESIIKDALQLAHDSIQEIISTQLKIVSTEPNNSSDSKLSHLSVNQTLLEELVSKYWSDAWSIYQGNLSNKEDRSKLEGQLRSKLIHEVVSNERWAKENTIVQGMTVDYLLHNAFRSVLLAGEPKEIRRSDGRAITQLRPIECAINVLPSVHGSSYFSRGDTHVVCTTTLGPEDRARKAIPLNGSGEEKVEYFMLHYDFPPYCTGEVGNATASNRRMVGHGNLAEKAVKPVLPSFLEFPYTVRVFSECTSSNGSSSMASACGATLSLLDAGVPIKALVAGVSVGLVTDNSFLIKTPPSIETLNKSTDCEGKYVLLKDILGSEDHHGDMDFKIAGSTTGITAIQLDVKLEGGVPLSILNEAIDVAKEARLEILSKMNPLPFPRALRPHVPRAELMQFDIERMSQLIGVGGEMIKFIEDLYKVELKILEDGVAYLYGNNSKAVQEAKELIEDIAVIVKEGMVVNGIVKDVKDYGAVIQINRGQMALLHISHVSHDPQVQKKPLPEVLKKGQKFAVEIIQVDKAMGLVKVSRKSLLDPTTSIPDNIENLPVETVNEETDSILAKVNAVPPKSWSKDFFLHNVVNAKKAQQLAAEKQVEKNNGGNEKKYGNKNNNYNKNSNYNNNGNGPSHGKKYPNHKNRPHSDAEKV